MGVQIATAVGRILSAARNMRALLKYQNTIKGGKFLAQHAIIISLQAEK